MSSQLIYAIRQHSLGEVSAILELRDAIQESDAAETELLHRTQELTMKSNILQHKIKNEDNKEEQVKLTEELSTLRNTLTSSISILKTKVSNAQIRLNHAKQRGKRDIAPGININSDKQDVNYRDMITGLTPIFFACEEGDVSMVKLLIDKKANINIKDNDGNTPLFTAIANDHISVVRILLDNNAELIGGELDTLLAGMSDRRISLNNMNQMRDLIESYIPSNQELTKGSKLSRKDIIINGHKTAYFNLFPTSTSGLCFSSSYPQLPNDFDESISSALLTRSHPIYNNQNQNNNQNDNKNNTMMIMDHKNTTNKQKKKKTAGMNRYKSVQNIRKTKSLNKSKSMISISSNNSNNNNVINNTLRFSPIKSLERKHSNNQNNHLQKSKSISDFTKQQHQDNHNNNNNNIKEEEEEDSLDAIDMRILAIKKKHELRRKEEDKKFILKMKSLDSYFDMSVDINNNNYDDNSNDNSNDVFFTQIKV